MTQTLERESTQVPNVSFVALAEQVPTREELLELTGLYVENPAHRIMRQLDELAILYDGRTDRTTDYDFNGRNMQFDVFATRDAAGDALEEIYTIQSQYSSQHGYVTSYGISVLEAGQQCYRMTVRGGELRIQTQIGSGMAEVTDPEQRERYIEDFIWRSIVATIRTTGRDPQERELADLDSLAKLHMRLYQGPKVVTPVDL